MPLVAVTLAPATLARLAPGLRLLARLARRDGLVLDAELGHLLGAAEAAERALPRRPPQPCGSSLAPGASAVPPSGDFLTAEQVAQAARVTARAVRLAAAQGRLVGRRGRGGAWRFTPQAVATWQASRRRSA
jgi:hypothetical protein